jgi:hypothetical protein
MYDHSLAFLKQVYRNQLLLKEKCKVFIYLRRKIKLIIYLPEDRLLLREEIEKSYIKVDKFYRHSKRVESIVHLIFNSRISICSILELITKGLYRIG